VHFISKPRSRNARITDGNVTTAVDPIELIVHVQVQHLKILVFGMMDGNNKRGRPHEELADDIVEGCGASLQEVNH